MTFYVNERKRLAEEIGVKPDNLINIPPLDVTNLLLLKLIEELRRQRDPF